jgi:hypothetical protein
MLEKVIIGLGCAIGALAGWLFYRAIEHLSLPAPLFFIVDWLGVVPGSVFVGIFSAITFIGMMVLGIERLIPQKAKFKSD